jgi:hypothetical protein
MSRFDTARIGRILAWTGAGLAWGTAITMAGLEPADAGAVTPNLTPPASQGATVPASRVATIPAPPARGLVILRYQPSVESTPEVRTIYVKQKGHEAALTQSAPAPAPRSGGS